MAAAPVSPFVPRRSGTALLDLVGNTPLVRVRSLSTASVSVLAKAEFANPGGSVKDRPALNMIRDGERAGKLRRGQTILDATSGNTGIAYAMIGAALGYRVCLCMPSNASAERKRLLQAYGAEVVYTDPAQGSDGAILRCREIYAADPDRYFYPDQYNNPANWQAHYHGTGVEILEQTRGRLTHFVAGLGTSGTCMGVTRRMREDAPHVKCWSVQPASAFHGLEGMKHMPTSIVPGIYDESLPDGNIPVETDDAHRMVRRMAREEGLLIGVSAGANLHAAAMLAGQMERGTIVTILCDGGSRYLSEAFWDDHD